MRLSEIFLVRILSPSLRQCVIFLICFRFFFLSLTLKFEWIPVADDQQVIFIYLLIS